MEEGWRQVERKKGKGKREKKVWNEPARGVPTWADIARSGGVSVNVFIGGSSGYSKPNARRAARRGDEETTRATATRFFFDSDGTDKWAAAIPREVCGASGGNTEGRPELRNGVGHADGMTT
jgi:hypothetical protein